MKLWPTLGVAFLLIAAWGTSMRLSWSLGRENARNEAQASTLKRTADTLNIISAGYRICSRCWRNSAWKISNAIRTERQDVNSYATILQKMNAPTLCLTLVLLTGCAGTQNAPRPAPSVRLIPQTLTIPVTPPPFPDTPTWGNLGIWGDRLLDALETCNADKRAIELLEQRRLQRLNNEDNNHAEN